MTEQPPEQRAYYHEAIEKVLAMRKIDLANAAQHPSEKGYYWGRAHRCDDILFWLHIEANIAAGVPEQPPEVPQREQVHKFMDSRGVWQAHVASLAQRETRDNPECFCPFCQAYLGRFYSNKIVMVRDDESVQAAFRSLAASQKMENSHLYENEAQSVAQREEAPKPPQEAPCGTAESADTSMRVDILPTATDASPFEGHLLLLPDEEWKQLSRVSQEKIAKWFKLSSEHLQEILDAPAVLTGTSQGLEAQITERLEDSRSSYDGEATVNWNEAVKEICAFIRTHDAERERSLREKLEGLAAKMDGRCGDHCSNSCPMCAARAELRALLAQQRETGD